MITIDLSKGQALDADLKALQQFNCTRILNRKGGATMFFIAEKSKQNHLRFFTRNSETIVILFCVNIK